jgi:hypothetical protein
MVPSVPVRDGFSMVGLCSHHSCKTRKGKYNVIAFYFQGVMKADRDSRCQAV